MTTLLIARHGEAAYEHPEVLSDDGGWLTSRGREQVAELAAVLRGRKVASVYCSELSRAVESATIAAEILGLTATPVAGLHEFPSGDLAGRRQGDPEISRIYRAWLAAGPEAKIPGGAETGLEVLGRYRTALDGLADLHRGETVLVVSHGGVMSYALPRLAGNVADDLAGTGYFPNCAVVELGADEHGFAITSWPRMDEWPQPAEESPVRLARARIGRWSCIPCAACERYPPRSAR